MEKKLTKDKPRTSAGNFIDGTNDAEKTVAFGANPLKTHRLYGTDEDLMRQIEDFEARLKVANGEEEESRQRRRR
jgi:hypothetical protein